VLYLKVWDVIHGSAVYIKTPNGKHIVIDLGVGSISTGSESFSPLLYLKDKMKINRLDEVIITHPHGDHIRDICNFDVLEPEAFYRPAHLTEQEIFNCNDAKDKLLIDKYIEINRRCGELASDSSPLKPDNNGGAIIQVFLSKGCDRININNHSLVTVVGYATSKILIPGDNEVESWNELLHREDFLGAIVGTDILFAPYHGNNTGYPEGLFKYIHPKLVIIQSGRLDVSHAVDRYSEVASGCVAMQRGKGNSELKCLSTSNDGTIEIAAGWNSAGRKSYLTVASG
jgi:beta-lactamase superfamily II metal-dependent hydrolase